MKIVFMIIILGVIGNIHVVESYEIEHLWTSEAVFEVPESICYDAERQQIYIANISGKSSQKDGIGFISIIDEQGNVLKLKWVAGLHAPKGMAVVGDRLYVSDIDQLVKIDIVQGSLLEKYDARGAGFLNDVCADSLGNVYVSDTEKDVIFRLQGEQLNPWMSGEDIGSPNGLFCEGDYIYIGCGDKQEILEVSISTGNISRRINTGRSIDGLKMIDKDLFLISDWAGRTALVNTDGDILELLDTRAQNINAADLEYLSVTGTILIPTFFANKITAFRLLRSQNN